MVFGNPAALWLLPIVLLILILGFWGWKVKKNISKSKIFQLDLQRAKSSQIKKYILAGTMVMTLIFALSLPKLPVIPPGGAGKSGEIVFMVDVSESMAAKRDLGSPNRLERVRPILYEIIDRFPEARFYPFHFTSIARSLTPPVTKEDFPYLKRSIARVLDINSVPGRGSDAGKSIFQVIEKIPKEKKAKIIVLFSDGEFFDGGTIKSESYFLDIALKKAVQEDVKIVTVGVGEKDGSTIPLYNEEGEFTGDFAKYRGKIFVTHLEEETLKKIASKTQGKYFFEEDYKGIIDFLDKNLEPVNKEEQRDYRDISYLFLIPIAVLWIIFARRYLR